MTRTPLYRTLVAALGLYWALAALAGCEVTRKAQTAPSDAVLSLSASSSFLAVSATTTLTVTARKLDGSAVPDGTEVVLSASAGDFDQRKVRVTGGQASAVYRAGSQTGTVQISASSGSVSAVITLRVASASPGAVDLSAEPSRLGDGGGSATVTARVRSSAGTPVVGAPVAFRTSTGTLSAPEVLTDNAGEAKTLLTTSASALVSARVGEMEAPGLSVRVRVPITLQISINPSEPTAGEPATVSFRAVTAEGQSVPGHLRVILGNGQTVDLGFITGSISAAYAYAVAGSYNLTAEFIDEFGVTLRETIRVTIKPKPGTTPTPDPTPTPTPPPGGGVAGDEIDPRAVTWLHTNVTNWAITSRVTNVTITRSEICVDHTGAGRFPTSGFGSIVVEGNVWIFAQFGGRWYGATYDWLRPGQVCKGVTGGELGPDQIRIAPMDASWPGPRSGETVGFMVSTRARDGERAGEERTNIVLVRWP